MCRRKVSDKAGDRSECADDDHEDNDGKNEL